MLVCRRQSDCKFTLCMYDLERYLVTGRRAKRTGCIFSLKLGLRVTEENATCKSLPRKTRFFDSRINSQKFEKIQRGLFTKSIINLGKSVNPFVYNTLCQRLHL